MGSGAFPHLAFSRAYSQMETDFLSCPRWLEVPAPFLAHFCGPKWILGSEWDIRVGSCPLGHPGSINISKDNPSKLRRRAETYKQRSCFSDEVTFQSSGTMFEKDLGFSSGKHASWLSFETGEKAVKQCDIWSEVR